MNSSTDTPGDASRIPVGYITRAHGIRGDVLVVPITDNPDRFVKGAAVFLEGRTAPLTVQTVRHHNDGLIVSFAEFTDRNAAEAVRKSTLTIDAAARRALHEDEYWSEDLVGLSAVTESGDLLGTVSEVVLGTAQDRLIVTTPDGRAVDVPFVAAIVDDPVDGRIVMRPPGGLFDPI